MLSASWGRQKVYSRARKVRRLEQQDRWDKEAINSGIRVPWRIVDGMWTLDRVGDTD